MATGSFYYVRLYLDFECPISEILASLSLELAALA